jgi:streptomycin 3"-adenylyltransferase
VSAPKDVPPEVVAFAQEVIFAVGSVRRELLLAAYLHGSATLGGWMPRHSDVDLLLVTRQTEQPDVEAEAVAEALVGSSEYCPGSGLECSVVTASQASRPRAPWRFLLHIKTSVEPKSVSVVRGVESSGDPDLLMHYVTCRAAGWAVHGPEPAVLIGPVDRPIVLSYLADELEWGLHHGSQAYAVLNACRALVYLHDEQIVSKIAGGTAALERGLGPSDVIRRALHHHQGKAPTRAVGEDSQRFVHTAVELLRSAARGSTIPPP